MCFPFCHKWEPYAEIERGTVKSSNWEGLRITTGTYVLLQRKCLRCNDVQFKRVQG